MNDFQREIYKTIDILTEQKLRSLGFDRTKRGRVVSINGVECVVQIDGENYTCKLRRGIYVEPNDIVFVKLPQNSSVDKYVETILGGNETPENLVISAEEILQKLKTVDGHGSGLDADTLDGKHGSEYATKEDLNGIDVDISGETIVENINLSTAIIDDKNLSASIKDKYTKAETDVKLDIKVDKVAGKQLSTEDFTTIEKTKLTGIEDGAEKNKVNSVNSKIGDVVISKSDIGLSNIENKSSATIRGEITNTNITNALGYTPENSSNKGVANGYAPLDSNIKIPLSTLPDIAKQQTYVVTTIADRDALSSIIMGEKCYITSTGDSYIWDGDSWEILAKADWENVNLQWTNVVGKPNSNVADIDDAVNVRHTHSNKSIIDTITQALINRWNSAWEHISDTVKHITTAERTKWNAVDNKADTTYVNSELSKKTNTGHTHTESDITNLDKYTKTEVDNKLNLKQNKLGYTPVNKAGDTISGALTVDRFIQRSSGIPTSNLGSPTVTEMALFESQFNNKTWFYPPDMFTFEYTNDGVNWIEHSVSETQIKNFVSGYVNANIQIPRECLQYRIRIQNRNAYVFVNSLYMYWSSSGNNTSVKINKKKEDGDWAVHTNSNQLVSSWPGHLYLPFSTIPWSRATTSGHYRYIEVLFTPNWNHATNNITLYSLELWGGYPSGSRSLFSWDGDKNAVFPAELKAGTFKKADGIEVAYISDLPVKLSELTKDINFDERYYTETETNTLLSGKVDNSRVLTDVPLNAKFTDTIYTHPSNHPASMITESATKRFVSDTEKSSWSGKAEISDIPIRVGQLENDKGYVTQGELGDAGFGDMVKSIYDTNNNGIVDNAEKVNGFTVEANVPSNAVFTDTKYTHPSTHPYSMITGAPTSLPANGGSADKSLALIVEDTRNTDPNPSYYPSRSVVADFKANAQISPPPPVTTGSSYSHIMTMNGWTGGGAGGGGETTQLAFGDSVAVRVSNGTTTWKEWNRMVSESDLNEKVKTNVPANAKFTDTVYIHPGSGTNPHATTKADVGLGSVQNYGIATQSEAEMGASNAKYMTPLRVKQAIDSSPVYHVGKTDTPNKNLLWINTNL